MDYEVFLVSRIQEEWQRTGDHSTAIRKGLTRHQPCDHCGSRRDGGRVRLLRRQRGPRPRTVGIVLASAIFLDAVVVRMILLPGVLELFGTSTWKLPRALGRHLPRVAIEAPLDVQTPEPEPVR
jgi:putative drug exporter of the RND superfamily